ncbi:hypothetical protein GALL_447420 [mine drainage metagenome]|uniref:Uncharacterized protein n=1 Tax=mine drainage metagenome TaxID=410659 RepID=A0A1J5PR37_9ZZZZ
MQQAYAPELQAQHGVQVPDQALVVDLHEKPGFTAVERQQIAPPLRSLQGQGHRTEPAGLGPLRLPGLGSRIMHPVLDDLRQTRVPGLRGGAEGFQRAVHGNVDAVEIGLHSLPRHGVEHQFAILFAMAQPSAVESGAPQQEVHQFGIEDGFLVGTEQQ